MNILQRYRDWRKRRNPAPIFLDEGDRFCVSASPGQDHSYECEVFEAVCISAPLVFAKRVVVNCDFHEVGSHVSFDLNRWTWTKVDQYYIDAVKKGPTDAE